MTSSATQRNGDVAKIEWEEDPHTFIFHRDKPGKTKMHVFPLDLADWIRIDGTYPQHMKMRQDLLTNKLDEVFVTTNSEKTRQCEQELFELLCEFLPNRLPQIFERTADGIYNRVTHETIPYESEENPILRVSRLTQEDWCLMEWSDAEEGYVLTSGVVCFPMKWVLREKHGMNMGRIHQPVGQVFKKYIKTRAYNVLKSLRVDSPVWRANWAIFNDMDGPMDLYTPEAEDEMVVDKLTCYRGETTGKELVFRAEYQTLRKLPKTKCIAFSIRTYQRYLSDFKGFPRNDSEALIQAIEGLDPEMGLYKGAPFWQDAAIRYLRQDVLGEVPEKGLLLISKALLVALTVVVLAVSVVYFSDRYWIR